MRRRARSDDGTTHPAELVTFDAEQWGGGPYAACRWWDARDAWAGAHPGADLPMVGPGPDVPFDPETDL